MKKQNLLKIIFFSSLIYINSEEIEFSSDYMTGTSKESNSTTTLIGNAFVKTETMEIKADSIELSGDNFRYITATGNVSGKNTENQMDFTCGKMKYDRTSKIANLEDSVHLIDLENDVDAKAQLIEYNQNTDIAIMQIEVSLQQKDNNCTAAYAIYRKKTQLLEMNGNPKIIQGKDTFRAQEISLNLDTQEITLDGRVRGTVTDSKETKKESELPDTNNQNNLQNTESNDKTTITDTVGNKNE